MKTQLIVLLLFACTQAMAQTQGTTGTGSVATPTDSANSKVVKHRNHLGSKTRKDPKPSPSPESH